jgi:hypothetical protein
MNAKFQIQILGEKPEIGKRKTRNWLMYVKSHLPRLWIGLKIHKSALVVVIILLHNHQSIQRRVAEAIKAFGHGHCAIFRP